MIPMHKTTLIAAILLAVAAMPTAKAIDPVAEVRGYVELEAVNLPAINAGAGSLGCQIENGNATCQMTGLICPTTWDVYGDKPVYIQERPVGVGVGNHQGSLWGPYSGFTVKC